MAVSVAARPPASRERATKSRASFRQWRRFPRPPGASDAGEFSFLPKGPDSPSAVSEARTAAGGNRKARRSKLLTEESQSRYLEAPSTFRKGANRQTLRGLPDGGDDSADRMFRSAEDTLRYWEKVWAKTHGPVAWAGHGVTQRVVDIQRYELGTNLPSWWGTRAPTIQLQASATGLTVFPAARLRYRRASDGLEGEVTLSTLWSSAGLPAIGSNDSLEVWLVEGPAWVDLVYW